MATMLSRQNTASLQFPWHSKRGKSTKMARADTPCSNVNASRGTSPIDKESIRRQIVGLAFKQDVSKKSSDRYSSATTKKSNKTLSSSDELSVPFLHCSALRVSKIDCINSPRHSLDNFKQENSPRPSLDRSKKDNSPHSSNNFKKDNSPRPLYESVNQESSSKLNHTKHGHILAEIDHKEGKMSRVETHNSAHNGIVRSKTPIHIDKQKPKIVRFRMDECSIGKQKAPIVNITDNKSDKYEIRGNAINMRKEGLKGLLAYKDICEENEKRQNSLQASLKIFRRRIKLNQEKFIQPNESTTEDYVINRRSPFCEVTTPHPQQEEGPASRPMSSDDHVRILRSALQNKHNGGNAVVKQTDSQDNGENYKNIKCSYRLPENHNWGKEVSFKDIKDDSIPNVKTYVLAQETHPHAKFKKNNIQNSVTLNTHNLSVHNSITHVNGHKMKIGDTEIAFDPRFVDWLEDSLSNVKLYKNSSFMSDDSLDCSTPSLKRRVSLKS
ncbi:hypothetical protein ACF0H5_009208 [Mactra antiquata]